MPRQRDPLRRLPPTVPVLRRVGWAPCPVRGAAAAGDRPSIRARLEAWFLEEVPDGAPRPPFPWAPLAAAVGGAAVLGLAAFGLVVLLGIGRPLPKPQRVGLVPPAPPAAAVPAVSRVSVTAPAPSVSTPAPSPQVRTAPPASSAQPAQPFSTARASTPAPQPSKASATPPLSVPGQVLTPQNAGGAMLCQHRREHGQVFIYGCHWVVNKTPGA